MASGEEKAERWRPRFTVRTLVILVSLVCVYFGAWEITKRNAKTRANATIYGDNDEPLRIFNTSIPMPFIVVRDEVQYRESTSKGGVSLTSEHRRSYHLWLFGPMFRLFYKEGIFLPVGHPYHETIRTGP